jgi:hypothetical protein
VYKSVLVWLALSLLGGCAFGVKHDYGAPLDLNVTTPASVAVGTVDARPYVVTGEKGQDFVGLSRGGFGNPFDVRTQSGKPLASDMSGAIVASLKGKGVNAHFIEVSPAAGPAQALAALRSAGALRLVLLTLREWKSDSMIVVGLHYDLDLRVFDRAGTALATKLHQGSDNLGRSGFAPGGGASVLQRYRGMMETLFQDPDIVKALQP